MDCPFLGLRIERACMPPQRQRRDRPEEIGVVLKPNRSTMRVLHFAPRVCWPLDTGAKLRNYHLARVLSERADIALLAFTDAEQSLGELEKFYEQVIAVPRDPGYTLSKIIRGTLGSTPRPVINYPTAQSNRALKNIWQCRPFDMC